MLNHAMINALNEIKEDEEEGGGRGGKASNAWNSSGERENWIGYVCVMKWIIGSFPTYLVEVARFFLPLSQNSRFVNVIFPY